MSTLTFSWQSFLVLMGLGISLNPAIAAIPQPVETEVSSQLMANLNLPDTDRGQPDASTGGGKRGDTCMTTRNKPLFRPILPVSADGTVTTKTTQAETTFWWHIPANNAIRAEFSIFTEDQNRVHHQVLEDIDEFTGLLSVALPEETLGVGKNYFWDLTLVCDQFDRSGDIYFYGNIERTDGTQLTIAQTPAAVRTLIATLQGQNSYLSLDSAEAQSLAAALESGADEAMVQMVSSRLLLHFKSVADAYAEGGNATTSAQQKLELAQLSAFFGLWSDAVNLIASEREDAPDEWQSLLKAIFPADNPSTVQAEDEIIELLMTADSSRF